MSELEPVRKSIVVDTDLEHRNFERHGAGGETMRTAVSSPGGWGSLLELYARRVAETKAGAA